MLPEVAATPLQVTRAPALMEAKGELDAAHSSQVTHASSSEYCPRIECRGVSTPISKIDPTLMMTSRAPRACRVSKAADSARLGS